MRQYYMEVADLPTCRVEDEFEDILPIVSGNTNRYGWFRWKILQVGPDIRVRSELFDTRRRKTPEL